VASIQPNYNKPAARIISKGLDKLSQQLTVIIGENVTLNTILSCHLP